MKLEIGSGKKPSKGYVHLDINKDCPHLEYVGPAWGINAPDNTFEEIYARHFLEHLTFVEANKTLQEWYRVLHTGGMVHIILPNLAFHCRQLSMHGQSDFVKCSNFDHAIAGLYGWQAKGEHHIHKWGYTKATIVKLFEDNNFRKINLLDCRRCDLELKACK